MNFEKFINFCDFFVNLQKFCLTIQKSVIELKIGNCSLLDKGEREESKNKTREETNYTRYKCVI